LPLNAIIVKIPREAVETWSFRLWGFSAPQTVTVLVAGSKPRST
jgi:hypothetical protein